MKMAMSDGPIWKTTTNIPLVWEYLVCQFDRNNPTIFEVESGPLEYISMTEELSRLGELGWELVGIGGWSMERALAYFKRVKVTLENGLVTPTIRDEGQL